MVSKSVPRILIGGTSSGCGKTTITCAILQALVNRGIKTASFKCGPDYIDPMFHSEIIGAKSANIDSFLCDNNTVKYLLAKNSSDCALSVIEGVMGYYDGMSFSSTAGSTCEIAGITASPAVITINCNGMANSVLAIIKGFCEFRDDNHIIGVILNQIAPSTYPYLKSAIEDEFSGRIEVYGYMPVLPADLVLESRHLGLVMADEIDNLKEKLNRLAEIAEESVDISRLIDTAGTAGQIEYKPITIPQSACGVKIGVAYDRAFCFYYRDNLELLEEMGAKIIYFSPIEDNILPDGLDGLYIGGGYPELYAEKLSVNIGMRNSIRKALENHLPCIAECGGFMYLSNSIDGFRTVGFLAGDCTNTKKLSHFGYVSLTACTDNLLCAKGETGRGHEFHYYRNTENGSSFLVTKTDGTSWYGIAAGEYLYAGFPHLHFYSNIKMAENFLAKCIEQKMS